jgi:hypothetical protein
MVGNAREIAAETGIIVEEKVVANITPMATIIVQHGHSSEWGGFP